MPNQRNITGSEIPVYKYGFFLCVKESAKIMIGDKIYEIAVNDLCLYAPSVFTRLLDRSKDFDGILNQDNVEAYYEVMSRIPIKDRMHMRNNPVVRISATEAEEIAILDALSSAPRDPDVLHGLSDIIHNDYINRLRQTLCLRVCEAYFANRPLEGRRLTREDMIFNDFLAAIKENDKKTPRSDGRCYRPGDFTRRHKR